MQESIESYLNARRVLVDEALHRVIGDTVEWPSHLHKALGYSLFGPGKRLRPILAIAGYEALASVPDLSTVMPAAMALELIHTYTLIHDDLPQMDDDDLRRGRPTNHRVYGEALAILAGDALQGMAFQVVTRRSLYPAGVDPAVILDVAQDIAEASGEEGVIGGQSMDLGYEQEVRTVDQLAFLFAKKTGGLIRASVVCGARLGGAAPWQLRALATFGDRLGLAFQLTDDLLDDVEVKTPDPNRAHRAVPSVIELIGERETREWLDRVIAEALQTIEAFDDRADPLRALARWLPSRKS